jgi:hypothetical protein
MGRQKIMNTCLHVKRAGDNAVEAKSRQKNLPKSGSGKNGQVPCKSVLNRGHGQQVRREWRRVVVVFFRIPGALFVVIAQASHSVTTASPKTLVIMVYSRADFFDMSNYRCASHGKGQVRRPIQSLIRFCSNVALSLKASVPQEREAPYSDDPNHLTVGCPIIRYFTLTLLRSRYSRRNA